jgi:hypothetical protein
MLERRWREGQRDDSAVRLRRLSTHYVVVHGWPRRQPVAGQKEHSVLATVLPAEGAEDGSPHVDGRVEPLQGRTEEPKATVKKYGRQKHGDEDRAIGIDGPVLRPDDRFFATPRCLCHCLISFHRPGLSRPSRVSEC